MVGVKSRLLSVTRGLAVMNSTFAAYRPHAGDFSGRDRGNLLAHETGTATTHGLHKAQERGVLFASPAEQVYEDQIVGINSRPGDLKVNVCRTKHLSNHRTTSSEGIVKLDPRKELSLEEAVEYIVDGEFVEVTPDAVRMGKRQPKRDSAGKIIKT